MCKMFSTRFHIDVQKEYIYLCLKKWTAFSTKEESIPSLDPEFYVTESFKITKTGIKPSCILYAIIDNSRLSQISLDIYLDRLHSYIKETFPTAIRIKTDS